MSVVTLLLTGCLGSLIPKRVEVGQDKVEAVPDKKPAQIEAEKQAAEFIARRAGDARDAALREESSPAVLEPLTDARDAAVGLRYSLGAPERPWRDSGAALEARLRTLEAKLDRAIDRHRDDVAPNVGKKVEGTGFLQVPYFLWVGGILGVGFLLWTGIKIVGAVYPPVGLGVAGVTAAGRIGARTASRALAQVVRGGEAFKQALRQSDLDDRAKTAALELFRRHQMISADEPVQQLVQELTKHPKIS